MTATPDDAELSEQSGQSGQSGRNWSSMPQAVLRDVAVSAGARSACRALRDASAAHPHDLARLLLSLHPGEEALRRACDARHGGASLVAEVLRQSAVSRRLRRSPSPRGAASRTS